MKEWLRGFFYRQPAPYHDGWRHYSNGAMTSFCTTLFLILAAYSGFWFMLGWWSK